MKKAADDKINMLFINPSSMPSNEQELFLNKLSILRVPNFSMPLGLIDMAAYLRKEIKNININILDLGKELFKIYLDYDKCSLLTLEQFIKLEIDKVIFVPQIIGISNLFSSSHNTSTLIAKFVKSKWPEAVVIFGGNHATNLYKELLKIDSIDYVVRGEGEISFTELVRKIINNEKNIDVYGVFDKNKAFKKEAELSPMIQNLDDIPLPAIDLLDINFYKKTVGGSMMFSRGCVFKCTFCSSHTVHGRKVRYKSGERILIEFEKQVNDYGFTKIIIEDDLFAARKDIFLVLAKKIAISYRKIKFFLPQGLSVAILDEEVIDSMVSMGIDESTLAIESGSPYVQKNIIKKNVSLSKAKDLIKYLRKKDFKIYVNFILGFPGETKAMMKETIKYMRTLNVDWIYIFHAQPLPGSDLYNQLVEKGIVDPLKFDWDGIRLGRRVFDTPEITAKELRKLIYDLNIDINYFNNINIKNKRYQRAIDIFNLLIIEQYPFHVVGRYCRALAYSGLKQKAKANAELKECVKWININEESRRLFENYGDRMPLLKKYLPTDQKI